MDDLNQYIEMVCERRALIKRQRELLHRVHSGEVKARDVLDEVSDLADRTMFLTQRIDVLWNRLSYSDKVWWLDHKGDY